MNTLICAGGSGARVLEALLHLCAAGLGPASLRLLWVDPDGANGNGDRVSTLVARYTDLHERFASQIGEGLGLFRTKLDLLEVGGQTEGLKPWSPIQKGERLREMLNVDLLGSTQTPADLVKLFFTPEELDMDLSQGFRGHPSLGSAAMSRVAFQKEAQPWRQLIEKLRNDLAQDDGARVFLAGSVFGGTGAAAFYPLARFLREEATVNSNRLKIGVSALAPYFRFAASTLRSPSPASRQAARAENFPLATHGAVDFYRHLQTHQRLPFDVVHWVGTDAPSDVNYAAGGPEQRNPSHFVELIAATAAIEFFHDPSALLGSYYSASGDGDQAVLEWRDLPLARLDRNRVRDTLLRFVLVGAVHTGFCRPLLRQEDLPLRPYRIPWYWERFASKGESLLTEDNQRALDALDDFFQKFHIPWWEQLHRHETVRLLNRAALTEEGGVRLDRLANLLWPDRSGKSDPEAVDAFYTAMVQVPKNLGGQSGAGSYLALLAHAADRFIASHYRKTGS
jgi:Tubulin like